MIDKILDFFGTDKILHFLVGAVISFMFTNVCMIQEGLSGVSCIAVSVIGLIAAIFFGLVKELIIDSTFDWKDLLATFIGGLFPIIINAVGAIFHVLSN